MQRVELGQELESEILDSNFLESKAVVLLNMGGPNSLFEVKTFLKNMFNDCLLYTSPSPRDKRQSRMPSSA